MITVERPKISPMVKSAIAEIERRGGCCEPEDILWLQHAARRCVDQHGCREMPQLIDCPVYVGGAWLYPLRRGCIEWLKSVWGEKWLEDVSRLAFAMAHAERVDYLRHLRGMDARMQVAAWRLALDCTDEALESAVDWITNPTGVELVEIETPLQRAAPNESNPFDWGDALCLLCHYYPGTKPDYWLWECSSEFTETMLGKVSKLIPRFDNKQVDPSKFEALSEFRSIVLNIIGRAKP
jgi:hypothetical protein